MNRVQSHKKISNSGLGGKVAVLVLNRDGRHFLGDCFESVLKNHYPFFDVFLIDNGSQDASVDFTRQHYPMVHIVPLGENLGFAGAYDRVIRELDHEYVVLLNNDTVVDSQWLQALMVVAEKDERIAACGSKIVAVWNPKIIDHAGGMLTLIGSGLDQGKWTVDNGQYDTTREVGFGCGCSLLIRRQAYLEVGGFDPEYIIYHEDVDLCWRMRLLGYKVMFVHDSLVYHHLGGGTIRSIEHPWKTYLCQKNRLANIIKNIGQTRLVVALFVSLGYDAVRSARFLLLRRFDLIRMIFSGYLNTLERSRTLVKDRCRTQEMRSVSDSELKQFFAPLILSISDYTRLIAGNGIKNTGRDGA